MVDREDGGTIMLEILEKVKAELECELNWEKNIEDTPPPGLRLMSETQVCAFISGSAMPYTDKDLLEFNDTQFLSVQADPTDYIVLRNSVRRRAHVQMLYNTLDRYLDQYVCATSVLAKLRQNDTMTFTLSEPMTTKWEAWQAKNRKGTAKPLSVDTTEIQTVPAGENNGLGGEVYRIPRAGAPLYLDYFCRSLCTQTDTTTKMLRLEYEGLPFLEKRYTKDQKWMAVTEKSGQTVLPPFELEDYWRHEYFSGISLSIELAAVYLEVSQRFQDDDLWDQVFDTFCKTALPTIAASHAFFSRIIATRMIFQEVMLNMLHQAYMWHDRSRNREDRPRYLAELIRNGLDRIGIFEGRCFLPLPSPELLEGIAAEHDQDVAELLQTHTKKLLHQVQEPVDVVKYVGNPEHGLAMFCNPKHENVEYYLDLLKAKGEISRARGRKDIIFQKARKAVLEAIRFVKAVNRDVERHGIGTLSEVWNDAKHREIAGKDVRLIALEDDIPKELWPGWTALQKQGGTLILFRKIHGGRHSLYDGPIRSDDSELLEWEVSIETIANLIQEEIARRGLEKNAEVHIWEYMKQECIEIVIKKGKS